MKKKDHNNNKKELNRIVEKNHTHTHTHTTQTENIKIRCWEIAQCLTN